MSIPIEPEPEEMRGAVMENCCFCRNYTRHWTLLPDRSPGEQVACCPACASKHESAEVLTKNDWFARETRLQPQEYLR